MALAVGQSPSPAGADPPVNHCDNIVAGVADLKSGPSDPSPRWRNPQGVPLTRDHFAACGQAGRSYKGNKDLAGGRGTRRPIQNLSLLPDRYNTLFLISMSGRHTVFRRKPYAFFCSMGLIFFRRNEIAVFWHPWLRPL